MNTVVRDDVREVGAGGGEQRLDVLHHARRSVP